MNPPTTTPPPRTDAIHSAFRITILSMIEDERRGASRDHLDRLLAGFVAAEADLKERCDQLAEMTQERDKLVNELTATRADAERLAVALEWWRELRDESKGVAGYHLNGAIAHWGEFEDPTDAALAAHATLPVANPAPAPADGARGNPPAGSNQS